ncbi:MAG: aldo/keto reductase [Bacteroides sp.]|nr:aldo/keto reductase [Bacteroides sp.]
MKEFTLNNGVKIPAVGLGVFRLENPDEAYQTVRTALETGYRHIDTAMIYGNEEAVGRAIKDSGISREEIFVTTKLWNDDQRSGMVHEAIEKSRKKLQVDYIDLYLVHWPVQRTYATIWKKMEQILEKGLTRAIGVCNYQKHHLRNLFKEAAINPAVNQIECYPYLAQQELIDYCLEKGIRPEAWGPLGAGKSDILSNPVITRLAEKYQKTPAQIVLGWNLQRGVIVIPKSSHRERQLENLQAAEFEMEEADVNQITLLNKNLRLGADPDNFNF